MNNKNDFEWITIVKDKNPKETWLNYASRSAANYGLSQEVSDGYSANVARGMKPRAAALEALEELECNDEENREFVKVYKNRVRQFEHLRILLLPNALLDFLNDDFNFTVYKRKGKNHTLGPVRA